MMVLFRFPYMVLRSLLYRKTMNNLNARIRKKQNSSVLSTIKVDGPLGIPFTRKTIKVSVPANNNDTKMRQISLIFECRINPLNDLKRLKDSRQVAKKNSPIIKRLDGGNGHIEV